MKCQIILSLFFIFFFSFCSAQNDIPANTIHGKCYAKYPIPAKPETVEIYTTTYPVYIGKDYDRVKLKTIKHTLSEKNGIKEFIKLNIIKKPRRVPATDIDYQTFETHEYIEATPSRFSDWIEVLCEKKVTTDIIQQIQKKLRSKGYDPGPDVKFFGINLQMALAKYQQDNNLLIGQLDFDTLNALDIHY